MIGLVYGVIVENNIAISQQLMEQNSWVLSEKESEKALPNPWSLQTQACPPLWLEQYQRLNSAEENKFDKNNPTIH